MSAGILEIKAGDYAQEVLGAPLAVLDFYSTECPPCEALAAKFEPLSQVYGQDVKFVKIFRQENRALAQELGVTGSPTLLFFKDGKPVGPKLTGGIKRSQIEGQLAHLLGEEKAQALKAQVKPTVTETDVVILGGGPAGLSAGIYLAQAHVKTILVDTALPGGAVATTHLVSNYPGFIAPMNGYMLSHQMAEQAKANGVEFRAAVEITSVDLEHHRVVLDGVETIQAKKLIIATGSRPRPLGIPGEKEYQGQGISYCATCDGKYYEDKDIAVIGGGNSAVEEALFLSKFARTVTIVHRSSHLKANQEAQDKARQNPKIKFLLDQEVLEFQKFGDYDMGLRRRDKTTGDIHQDSYHGIFVFVGFIPNLEGFPEGLAQDEWGYLLTDAQMRTNLPGVYSVGDVNAKHYRQITTAVADGTIAAITLTKELDQ